MSCIDDLPLLLAYSVMHVLSSGSVSDSSSHWSSNSIDLSNVSTRPASLHTKICEHVSFSVAQLGQFLKVLSQGLLSLAAAILMTCSQLPYCSILSERRCRHVSGNSYVSGGATCLRYDHGDRIVFSGKSLASLSQTIERTRSNKKHFRL